MVVRGGNKRKKLCVREISVDLLNDRIIIVCQSVGCLGCGGREGGRKLAGPDTQTLTRSEPMEK